MYAEQKDYIYRIYTLQLKICISEIFSVKFGTHLSPIRSTCLAHTYLFIYSP
jgi:hypothetical protein